MAIQVQNLELCYDGKDWASDSDFLNPQEGIEWKIGQSKYLVTITFADENIYGNVALIIANSKNEPIETVLMSAVDENGHKFSATSTVAQFLRSGSKIYLGVVSGKLDFDDDGKIIGSVAQKSSLLPVTLINSVNTGLDPEVLANNSTIVDELIKKFSSADAKAISNIYTKEDTVNYDGEEKTGYHLYIQYLGETEAVPVGLVSVSLIDLGAQAERDNVNDKGGGGHLGNGASLSGSKTGFAGGYNSLAYAGAAVGENAVARDGFAAGRNARAKKPEGIAIGVDSFCQGENSIVLGSKAETSMNSNASVVIGRLSFADSAKNSVIIGCSNWTQEDDQGNPDLSDLEKTEGSFTTIKRTKAKETSNGVIIGPNAYTLKASAPIAIGYNATVRGQDKHSSFNGIAIGNNAITRYRSGISIGVNAKAGTTSTGGAILGNELEESKTEKNLGHVAAIAIGRGAFAKRHGTIALGKHAKAIQYGNISIGQGSIAGVENDTDTTASGEATDNFRAVAIGYHATATAKHSVQLGQGTNNTPNSLQFRNVTVVKDGAVQVNLSGKGVQGVLPINNGGTGASSKKDAINNLGIFTGKASFSITKAELEKQGEGKDIEVKFEKAFSSPPHVIASLELYKVYDPSAHHIFIHSVTSKGFTIRYKYTGTSEANKNINVNYVSVG